MTHYAYCDRNLLETREHYFYSALQGPDFLDAYRATRIAILETLPVEQDRATSDGKVAVYPASDAREIRTADLMDALEAHADLDWLDRLVQRFEVTKRLYDRYDGRLRKPGGECGDLAPYARLAAVLAREVEALRDLKWLNALLKLNDLLCSQPEDRRLIVGPWLAYSLTVELDAVASLRGPRGGMADA